MTRPESPGFSRGEVQSLFIRCRTCPYQSRKQYMKPRES
jgi:hypothetical protein